MNRRSRRNAAKSSGSSLHYDSDEYNEHIIKLANTESKVYISKYLDNLRMHVEKRDRVLDIGCGTGESTSLMAKFCKAEGSDISKFRISTARNNFPDIPFHLEDGHKTKFKDNAFDCVTSVALIEHIDHPEQFLDELYRITRTDGLIIICSPNWFSPFKILKGIVVKKNHLTMGKTRLEMLRWCFWALYQNFKKIFKMEFIKKTPDFSIKQTGHDIDMVYVSHPMDLVHFYRKKNCEILNLRARGFKLNFIPYLAPWYFIVARKK